MNDSSAGFIVVLGALIAVVVAVVVAFGPMVARALDAFRVFP